MTLRTHRTLHLGVMAKYWRPGAVKTRLGRVIGLEKSAQLHHLFCQFLSDRLRDAADSRSFVITPSESRSLFEASIPPSWSIEIQSDGDLGRRMQMWFAAKPCGDPISSAVDTLQPNPNSGDKVLIGADCPMISEETITRARQCLDDHDVVLGPAADGGYYLIGLRQGWRPEFEVLLRDIDWGESSVFQDTMRRGRDAGLRIATLGLMEDVDTAEDLDRLRESLRRSDGSTDRRLLQSIERVLGLGVTQ